MLLLSKYSTLHANLQKIVGGIHIHVEFFIFTSTRPHARNFKGDSKWGGEGDGGDFPIKIMVMLHVVGKFESALSEDKRILFCGQGSNLF